MPYDVQHPPGFGIRLASVLTGGLAGAAAGIPQYRQQQELQAKAAIESERQRQQKEQEIIDDVASVGQAPIRNPDGSLNVLATRAAALQKQTALESAKLRSDVATRNDVALGERAKTQGIDPTAPQMPKLPQGFQFGQSAPLPNAQPAKPLQQQVADAEAAQKQAEFDRQKSMASQTTLATGRAATAAKEIEDFRKTFGRDPGAAETTDEGFLNASALGSLRKAADKVASGYRMADNGGWEVIPGGPAEQKQQQLAEKAAHDAKSVDDKLQMLADTTGEALDNIRTALPLVGMTTAGNVSGGSVMRNIPVVGQNAQDLHSALASIQAGLGVNKLNEMRASSGNGTTGIGRIMQVEFEAFAKSARNLDQEQSPAQLRRNLIDLQTHLQKWQDAHAKSQAEGQAPSTGGATGGTTSQPGTIKITSIKRVQ